MLLGHRILAMLGLVAAWVFLGPLAFNKWIELGWSGPGQEWMIDNGAGSIAGHFGLFYLPIPD